jgi:hypothetical protein
MDPNVVSGLAALLGAIIGGCTSVLASWVAQNSHAKAEWHRQQHLQLETLYKEFIENAVECFADALQHDRPDDVPTLIRLYGKIDLMQLHSTRSVIEAAEAIRDKILETYLDPNKEFPEISEMVRSGSVNLVGKFSSESRKELESVRLGAK